MDQLLQVPLTLTTNKAGLTAGTTTTYSITANPLLYAIRGKAFSKATVTNGATPTTDANSGLAFKAQAIGTGSVYVFGYDASGNVKVSQGSIENLDPTGAFFAAPLLPDVVDTMCPFGYLLVRLAPATATTPAVAPWTFGTNNLSGVTGVTYTFVDVMTLPDRPQVL